MSYTKGPWKYEAIAKWPYGVRVSADEKEILNDSATCHSTEQKSRADCENGVGFDWHNENFTNRKQAQELVAEQDANARLISTAPDGLALAEMVVKLDANLSTMQVKDWDSCVAVARALVEKAEGK